MTTTSAVRTSTPEERSLRWDKEARFFDNIAADVDESTLHIDPLALQRYTQPVLRKRFNKELRFRILGSLAGKNLLDVGCGDGLNAVMFAKMGARVTGLDISPGAIGVARRRAELNGVSERTTFICAPLEMADLPADQFDIVWGDAILHHVLADLELVLEHMARACKPSGLLLFSEPVNLANSLRRLRSLIPLHTDATPDERPLIKAELDLVKRYVPNSRLRYYGLFGRLDPFILTKCNYERSSLSRRIIVNAIDSVDYALLSLPTIKRLASVCVIYGQPSKRLPIAATDA